MRSNRLPSSEYGVLMLFSHLRRSSLRRNHRLILRWICLARLSHCKTAPALLHFLTSPGLCSSWGHWQATMMCGMSCGGLVVLFSFEGRRCGKRLRWPTTKKEKLLIDQRRFALTVDSCHTLMVTYLVACWSECSWAMMMLWCRGVVVVLRELW